MRGVLTGLAKRRLEKVVAARLASGPLAKYFGPNIRSILGSLAQRAWQQPILSAGRTQSPPSVRI